MLNTAPHLAAAPVTDNGDAVGINRSDREPIAPGGVPVLGQRYEVPARHGRAVHVKKGQSIKIINTHGLQVCDTWAFKADDLSEFMSMEHARAFIDKIIPQAGDPLVSNRRRAIMTLVEDTSPGVHDTLIAACDAYRYQNLGVVDYHDNCADNMRLALKAIGLRAREVPQPLNLWMNIPVGQDNGIQWLPPVSKAGDHVVLRAEMDCVVVMSACPQDIIPINNKQPVAVHFEVLGESA